MKRVAITGMGINEKLLVTSGIDEIWTCNNGYKFFNKLKLTKLFIVHKQVYVGKWRKRPVFDWHDISESAISKDFEILTLHEMKEVLRHRIMYPLSKIEQMFFPNSPSYFSSSFDYMMAFALLEGYEEIHLFDTYFVPTVSNKTDDLWEKAGLEYWIGRAHGMGKKVVIWYPTNLLQSRTGEIYAVDG